MNRRHFLTLLGAAAAGAALDPDFLKWEPGARRYFDLHRPALEPFLRKGDIFTIEGRYAINPVTLERVMVKNAADLYEPVLRQFVVTADVTGGASFVPYHPQITDRHGIAPATPHLVRPREVTPFLVGDTVGGLVVGG